MCTPYCFGEARQRSLAPYHNCCNCSVRIPYRSFQHSSNLLVIVFVLSPLAVPDNAPGLRKCRCFRLALTHLPLRLFSHLIPSSLDNPHGYDDSLTATLPREDHAQGLYYVKHLINGTCAHPRVLSNISGRVSHALYLTVSLGTRTQIEGCMGLVVLQFIASNCQITRASICFPQYVITGGIPCLV